MPTLFLFLHLRLLPSPSRTISETRCLVYLLARLLQAPSFSSGKSPHRLLFLLCPVSPSSAVLCTARLSSTSLLIPLPQAAFFFFQLVLVRSFASSRVSARCRRNGCLPSLCVFFFCSARQLHDSAHFPPPLLFFSFATFSLADASLLAGTSQISFFCFSSWLVMCFLLSHLCVTLSFVFSF